MVVLFHGVNIFLLVGKDFILFVWWPSHGLLGMLGIELPLTTNCSFLIYWVGLQKVGVAKVHKTGVEFDEDLRGGSKVGRGGVKLGIS